MDLHTPVGRLHQHSPARAPHSAAEQGRSEVRARQLRLGMRLMQPQARRPRTRTTTRATTYLDLVADLLPALLLIAIMIPLPVLVVAV